MVLNNKLLKLLSAQKASLFPISKKKTSRLLV